LASFYADREAERPTRQAGEVAARLGGGTVDGRLYLVGIALELSSIKLRLHRGRVRTERVDRSAVQERQDRAQGGVTAVDMLGEVGLDVQQGCVVVPAHHRASHTADRTPEVRDVRAVAVAGCRRAIAHPDVRRSSARLRCNEGSRVKGARWPKQEGREAVERRDGEQWMIRRQGELVRDRHRL